MKTQKSRFGKTALRRKRRGGSGWLWVALAVWGFHGGAGLLTGCGEVNEGGGTDSNTHWLDPCQRDADCGGLVCLCGQCTQPCEDDGACGDLPGASCAQSNACSGASEPSSCVAECRLDADCGALREGLRCLERQCVSVAEASSSGGAPPGNSSRAGSGGDGAGNGGTSAGNGGTGAGNGGTSAGNGGAVAGNGGTTTAGSGGEQPGAGGSTAGTAGTAGNGPTGPCAPMDVNQTGIELPCLPGAPTYAWNGDYCAAFSACSCEGEDCDELYPTLTACDASYQVCYESQGITGACEQDADCRLTYRGCCEPCADVVGLDGLAATTEGEEANWHVCQQTADCDQCAEPPYEPTREALAACVENRCTVVSPCEGLNAEQCNESSMCKSIHGHPPGVEEDSYLGCSFDPQADHDAPSQCDVAELCAIADTEDVCLQLGTHCVNQKVPQGFRLTTCEDPACLP